MAVSATSPDKTHEILLAKRDDGNWGRVTQAGLETPDHDRLLLYEDKQGPSRTNVNSSKIAKVNYAKLNNLYYNRTDHPYFIPDDIVQALIKETTIQD